MLRRIAGSPWTCAALILVSPQLMAGVFGWSILAIALGSTVALALALVPSASRRLPLPAILWASALVMLWTGVQLVPLGTAVSEWITPDRTQAQHQLTRILGGLPPSATAITFDPGATRLELIKCGALLCALAATYLVAQRGHARTLLMAVAGSGATMALVALAHRAVDAHSVFGLYRSQEAVPRLPAPILNDNCLAGFMALTAPIALGVAVTEAEPRTRAAFYFAGFVIVSTGLLTGSRAGTAAVVFALAAFLLAVRLRPRDAVADAASRPWTVISFVGASAATAAIVIGAEPLFAALNSTDASKISVIARALRVAMEHPWVGVGRGGFSAAFASDMDDAGRSIHAENFIVTWVAEWGLPVGTLLLAVFGRVLLRMLAQRSVLLFSAGLGVLAIALQNLFDLAFELLGIAVVVAATLGATLGAMAETQQRQQPTAWSFRRAGLAFVITTVGLLAWIAPSMVAAGEGTPSERLEEAQKSGRAHFRRELSAAVALHPYEPSVYFAAAREAVSAGDPKALRWLNLAMLRAPRWSAPYAEAARLLLAIGRPHQAALEAREATALHTSVGAATACAVARVAPDPKYVMLAAEGVRSAKERQLFFDAVTRCLPDAVVRAVDQILMATQPDVSGPVLRERQRLIREGRRSDAERLVAAAAKHGGADPQVVLVYAQELLAQGKADQAAAEALRAQQLGAAPEALARTRAQIATAKGQVDRMREEIENLRALGASSGRRLADAALLRARLERVLGNSKDAADALDEALALDPSPDTLREALALAEAAGDTIQAVRFRDALCAIAAETPVCRRRSPRR